MFGTGLLKGLGITLKHFTDTFADDRRKEPARYEGSIQIDDRRRVIDQPITQEGLFTIQYPEERRLLPERFRYIPMLIWDTEVGEDRCTACGICAKVCPPQCIWIVRDMDDNGKPVTRPAEFYIDVAVCMSCSFCTEFCPFDAIKMNHDYELAVYDRYPQLVYDKAELTVPLEYYAALWPSQFAEEQARRAQEKEEERRREEEKKLAAEAKAKAAAESQAAKRSQEAPTSPAARKAEENGETAAGDAAEAEAKRARLEEMKRKAAEKAAQRKKESGS
jgi:NADH-quinone oxidoreductase subunit I